MEKEKEDIFMRPLRYLKGIGEARAKLFEKLGIGTVKELVTYYPRQYEDRRALKTISALEDGETCSFRGTIASTVRENRPKRGMTVSKLMIEDETGVIAAVWFNQPYIKTSLKPGGAYVFYGKILRQVGLFQVQSPIYESVDSGDPRNTCRIIPVYPSTAKLSQNVIRGAIMTALKLVEGSMPEILPEALRNGYGLPEINYSISNIHFPASDEDFSKARKRLVFEEFLMLQLGLQHLKRSLQENRVGIQFKHTDQLERFMENLPFQLTGAQVRTYREIEKDMESPKVMNRLVQGDVGSGKTIVAVLALLKAVLSGYQGALLVPTEILAQQHYSSISPMLRPLNIRTGLMTGSLSKKEKQSVSDMVEKGEIQIVIGTHALIEEGVKFSRLGLVVTDEQHRFGVRQRSAISRKGQNPDILVMTATPIPRTLALILYGDLDISILDELPPGRKRVETYSVDEKMRPRIDNFIRKQVAEGRQVYVVCPLVEDADGVEAKSAAQHAQKIAMEEFKDLRVGLIHGQMKATDKEEVMKSFVMGGIDILVSTTVIEVGVNVPNASVMVIENAERFGLAQLHQLRGRVGRGEHQSYCILYHEGKSRISAERMKVMQKTGDGFAIAEKDLDLRGPGEFFGIRQHGLPEFRIANVYSDMELLKDAQAAAEALIREDPLLVKEEHASLKGAVLEKLGKTIRELSF